MPKLTNDKESNLFFVNEDESEHCAQTIVDLVSKRLPSAYGFNAATDIQVLSPIHKGVLGTQNLNALLKRALNKSDTGVARGDVSFNIGDKVMQIRNDYDRGVFNGDIGQIIKIDPVEREVTVKFDQREVVYDFGELDEVALAYAITIHKSQGSEFPAVVIPLATQQYLLLQRNLVYTGITRGKKLVVVVGHRKALAKRNILNRTWNSYTVKCSGKA